MALDSRQYEEEEYSATLSGAALLRLLRLTLNYRGYLAGYVAGVIGMVLAEGTHIYLGKRILDEGVLAGDLGEVKYLLWLWAGVAVALAGCVALFIFCAGSVGQAMNYDLRKTMFGRLQELSLAYYDRTPVGWIMARATSDSRRVSELVSFGFLDMFWGMMSILVFLGFMAAISWQLALVMLAVVPVMVGSALLFQRHILGHWRDVRRLNSRITGNYAEGIHGVRVTKSLGREDSNLAEFAELATGMYRSSFRAAWLSAAFLPVVQVLAAVAVALIIQVGGLQFQTGVITLGGIQAFIQYIFWMLFPIQEMARVYAQLQQAVASAERIFSLIDSLPEVQDQPGAMEEHSLRGAIEFDAVNFAYEPDNPILQGFNLRVEEGETIALVGPTGAGKSTVVNLLCRFYEPLRGSIRINGQDLRGMTLHALHSRIGMVLQSPYLFSGSVMDNLRYGRLDATDAEVWYAAELAGAADFIDAFEDGYATDVGEGGSLLSAGQKQLISLARAILARPDIFIMDEATSSVDTMTEARIQQGMEQLLETTTSFVIAHRLSTIRNADRILVIKDGGIAEMGSHQELIRAGGYYHDLYRRQFRDEKSRTVDPFFGSRLVHA
ncbi:MAG: ABC transporter ATP-binding protein [Caldilineaceae bacterium]|nr:ABC transporter ATP-binding protein [Caldilineaceae bacterium]